MVDSNMPTKTGWIIIILALIVLIWELYVIFLGSDMKTISEEIWMLNDRSAGIPFAAGLLAGHFFWPRKVRYGS